MISSIESKSQSIRTTKIRYLNIASEGNWPNPRRYRWRWFFLTVLVPIYNEKRTEMVSVLSASHTKTDTCSPFSLRFQFPKELRRNTGAWKACKHLPSFLRPDIPLNVWYAVNKWEKEAKCCIKLIAFVRLHNTKWVPFSNTQQTIGTNICCWRWARFQLPTYSIPWNYPFASNHQTWCSFRYWQDPWRLLR